MCCVGTRARMYMDMCDSVWGLSACVCMLMNGRLGWETQISPSQPSTPVPWGPDGGEQRVPKPCDLGRWLLFDSPSSPPFFLDTNSLWNKGSWGFGLFIQSTLSNLWSI